MSTPQHVRALAVAAIPARLSPALWAKLCARVGYRNSKTLGLLAALEQQGRLQAEQEDLVWTDPNRAGLTRKLARERPDLWQLAHQTAAAFFIQRANRGDLVEAVRHLLALGDRPQCQRLLGSWAMAAIDRGDIATVLAAIEMLRESDAPTPRWLVYLEAVAQERMGELSEALERYDRFVHARARGRLPAWVPAPAEICARAGMLAVRTGELERGQQLLDKARTLASAAPFSAIEQLAARLDLGRGMERSAKRHFKRALNLATAEADSASQVEALSGLGVIAMRTGDPQRAANHYRRALAHTGGAVGDEARAARIRANLAMALATCGRWSEATTMFGQAIEHRRRLGDLAGVANSLAARAGAREGSGDVDGAWHDLVEARHRAAQIGDPGLLMEVHLLRANLASRRSEIATARNELSSASKVRNDLEHPDPLLDAMLDETRAELQLASRKWTAAQQTARRARRAFTERGADFWAARVDLLLARIAFAAAHNDLALSHLRNAAARATAASFHFSGNWAWSSVLEFGAAQGNELVRDFCHMSLGHRVHKMPPLHPSSSSGTLRIMDRQGIRLATPAAVRRLRQHPPPLLVDFPRQMMLVDGRQLPLGKRRILLPLLHLFLANPKRALDIEQLHREVWGTDRLDEADVTRVKVSLSRLRQLVGRQTIETRKITGPTGISRTRFQLRPTLDYAVIERG